MRNNEDGTVEAVLEGDASAVALVLAWMRSGPPRALVTGVEITAEPLLGEVGFRAR